MRYGGEEKIVVLLDGLGYKTLSVPAVTDRGLLAPVT